MINHRRDGLHACRCTLGTDRSQRGLRRKPGYAANASVSGACLFLTVIMPPLPGYRKVKPRGGLPMHGPIWRTRSKSGEAPSLRLAMGMSPLTIPPETSCFPTTLRTPIARMRPMPRGVMRGRGECAKRRFRSTPPRSAATRRGQHGSSGSGGLGSGHQGGSRPTAHAAGQSFGAETNARSGPPYTRGSADRPVTPAPFGCTPFDSPTGAAGP